MTAGPTSPGRGPCTYHPAVVKRDGTSRAPSPTRPIRSRLTSSPSRCYQRCPRARRDPTPRLLGHLALGALLSGRHQLPAVAGDGCLERKLLAERAPRFAVVLRLVGEQLGDPLLDDHAVADVVGGDPVGQLEGALVVHGAAVGRHRERLQRQGAICPDVALRGGRHLHGAVWGCPSAVLMRLSSPAAAGAGHVLEPPMWMYWAWGRAGGDAPTLQAHGDGAAPNVDRGSPARTRVVQRARSA